MTHADVQRYWLVFLTRIFSGQLSSNTSSAFSVKFLRDASSTLLHGIRFTEVLLNEGEDYSTMSGIFTCRIPGLYFFTVTLTKQRGGSINLINCQLKINSVNKLSIYVDPYETYVDIGSYSSTVSGAFALMVGDTVTLEDCSPASYFDPSRSSFSGFLIREANNWLFCFDEETNWISMCFVWFGSSLTILTLHSTACCMMVFGFEKLTKHHI